MTATSTQTLSGIIITWYALGWIPTAALCAGAGYLVKHLWEDQEDDCGEPINTRPTLYAIWISIAVLYVAVPLLIATLVPAATPTTKQPTATTQTPNPTR